MASVDHLIDPKIVKVLTAAKIRRTHRAPLDPMLKNLLFHLKVEEDPLTVPNYLSGAWAHCLEQMPEASYWLLKYLADIRAVLAVPSSDTKQADNLNLTEVACPVVVRRVDHPGAHLDHLMVHYV